jgi:hypothetical protein
MNFSAFTNSNLSAFSGIHQKFNHDNFTNSNLSNFQENNHSAASNNRYQPQNNFMTQTTSSTASGK